ncbi:MAG: hypothetical protein RRZ24_00790 [Clostridia bacterium]
MFSLRHTTFCSYVAFAFEWSATHKEETIQSNLPSGGYLWNSPWRIHLWASTVWCGYAALDIRLHRCCFVNKAAKAVSLLPSINFLFYFTLLLAVNASFLIDPIGRKNGCLMLALT